MDLQRASKFRKATFKKNITSLRAAASDQLQYFKLKNLITMFAFAELTHSTKTGYDSVLTFVKVVELTHEKSFNKRAVIEYTYKGENQRHYIPRDRLITPEVVHSEILYYAYHSGWEYCIEGRADFFKHPAENYVNMSTKYVITELKVNGHRMKNVAEVADYMNADKHELDRQILAKFVDYADELPF